MSKSYDASAEKRLDRAVSDLPRDIEPARDLWPGIAARIEAAASRADATATRPVARPWPWAMRLAAAVLLVVGSSLATLWVSGPGGPGGEASVAAVSTPGDAGPAGFAMTPASFASQLPTDYLIARQELTDTLEYSLPRLAPDTQRVVERNLREIQQALGKIDAALASDPGNESLQRLLLATSQQELRYLNDVRRLAENVTWKQDI